MPIHKIQHGKVLQLQVPVSKPRHFLAGASPPPHYTAKAWANGPPGEPKDRTDAVKVEIKVTSSKEPGATAVQELTFFIVPPKLLAKVGLLRTVSIHIQIDKLTS
ncbi:uncharacterized protein [Aegilops tauschii subsp. strangulata]|uniref:uncharacterized protein n=1 Tax=Aegilops tauschii subsp. strangulata TaxID=200361 RepID=UPI003CC89342